MFQGKDCPSRRPSSRVPAPYTDCAEQLPAVTSADTGVREHRTQVESERGSWQSCRNNRLLTTDRLD